MALQQTRFAGRKVARSVCVLLLLAALPPALAGEESAPHAGSSSWGLGQVITGGAKMAGVRLPAGSTLVADSLLETGDEPATVHLQGGQVLRLAGHSSAYFAAVGDGVRMDVRSGQATVRGNGPKPRTLSTDMVAFLSSDGRVGEQIASLTSAGFEDDPPPLGTGVEVGAPAISGAERSCLPNVPYPLVDAVIQPGPDVKVAKVYFRAAQHPNFYAVEMTSALDDFEAILPAPGPGTDQVIYYVEAVSNSLESSRTEEYTADVREDEDCDTSRFLGKKPKIALLPTVPNSPLVPPGFQPLGILGAAGGGLGAGALTGIIGGGLAGGVLLLDELEDDERPASPVAP